MSAYLELFKSIQPQKSIALPGKFFGPLAASEGMPPSPSFRTRGFIVSCCGQFNNRI